MEEHDILLALCETDGIGWETVHHIVNAIDNLQDLLERNIPKARLKEIVRSEKKAEKIEQFLTREEIAGKLRFYETCNVKIVTWFDPLYPPWLRFIHKPPWVLYAQGDVELLQLPSVSIVGTRRPSPYGREVAEWFGSELASAGLAVVSGLARGIDGAAHIGALRAKGPTIAVLGNGLNVKYPPEHHALQRQIEKNGLVISEYVWNTKPGKVTFPWRNRIIAGMSRGTVVVEAARESGSLITARMALEAGRDVFAIPGPITSPRSAGVHGLLREGAIPTVSPSEILAQYGVGSQAPAKDQPAEHLTTEEADLLAVMGADTVTVDDLLMRTGGSFGQMHTVLLSLLVKNRIRALPGSAYIARLN